MSRARLSTEPTRDHSFNARKFGFEAETKLIITRHQA
jgi:hypothetical protein